MVSVRRVQLPAKTRAKTFYAVRRDTDASRHHALYFWENGERYPAGWATLERAFEHAHRLTEAGEDIWYVCEVGPEGRKKYAFGKGEPELILSEGWGTW